jgi:probable F420-dependent oxidoreductase
VLVAKQAACLDVLSSGRLRMGIGLGWNKVEYMALNEDCHTRGRRIEEQVQVLRELWTKPLVNFTGRWHTIPDAGLKPLPVQRPIPIWFGGHHQAMLARAARWGDGWMPNYRSAADAAPSIAVLHQLLEQAGRSRETFGIEARMSYGAGEPAVWEATMSDWQAAGATHLSINTMGLGFTSAAQHLEALKKFAAEILSH